MDVDGRDEGSGGVWWPRLLRSTTCGYRLSQASVESSIEWKISDLEVGGVLEGLQYQLALHSFLPT